jgi:hypothetical protein
MLLASNKKHRDLGAAIAIIVANIFKIFRVLLAFGDLILRKILEKRDRDLDEIPF